MYQTRFGRAASQGVALAAAAAAAPLPSRPWVKGPYAITAEQKAEKAQRALEEAEAKAAEKARREAESAANAGNQRKGKRLSLADYMAKLKKEGWM